MSMRSVLSVRSLIVVTLLMGSLLVGCTLTGLYETAKEKFSGSVHVGAQVDDESTNAPATTRAVANP